MKKCPLCETEADDAAERCPFCGYKFPSIKITSDSPLSDVMDIISDIEKRMDVKDISEHKAPPKEEMKKKKEPSEFSTEDILKSFEDDLLIASEKVKGDEVKQKAPPQGEPTPKDRPEKPRPDMSKMDTEDILKSFDDDLVMAKTDEKKAQAKPVKSMTTASSELPEELDSLLKDLEEDLDSDLAQQELDEDATSVQRRTGIEHKAEVKPIEEKRPKAADRGELEALRQRWSALSSSLSKMDVNVSGIQETIALAERRAKEGDINASVLGYRNAISKATKAAQAQISDGYQEASRKARQTGDAQAIRILNEVRQKYSVGDMIGASDKLAEVHAALARAAPIDAATVRQKVNMILDALEGLDTDLSAVKGHIAEGDRLLIEGQRIEAQQALITAYRGLVHELSRLLGEEMEMAKEASERAKLKNLRISNQLAILKKATMLFKSKKYEECARSIQAFHQAILPFLKRKTREKERKRVVEEKSVKEEEEVVQETPEPVPQVPERQRARPAPQQAVASAPRVKVRIPQLQGGIGYLVKERKPHLSYFLYSKHLAEGKPGMCICTGFPERIREKYDLYGSGFIWLTTIRDAEQGYDPERLDFEVSQEIYDFITRTKGYIILFDALDILISEHKEDKAVEFIRYLTDHAAMDGGVLVVAISPFTVSENVTGQLERFLEEVQLPQEREELEELLRNDINAGQEAKPKGHIFLIDGGLVSLDRVKNDITKCGSGIAFSRESEGRVRPVISKYQEWTKIYTFSPQPFQNTMPAGDIRQIKKTIDSYLIRSRAPLVCLEGIDLCINECGAGEMLKLLESIKKEILHKSGVLIIILRRNNVEPQVWSAMEKIATQIF